MICSCIHYNAVNETSYQQPYKIVSLSTQGRKIKYIARCMELEKVDILCAQEVKIPTNMFRIGHYWFVTSTDITGEE